MTLHTRTHAVLILSHSEPSLLGNPRIPCISLDPVRTRYLTRCLGATRPAGRGRGRHSSKELEIISSTWNSTKRVEPPDCTERRKKSVEIIFSTLEHLEQQPRKDHFLPKKTEKGGIFPRRWGRTQAKCALLPMGSLSSHPYSASSMTQHRQHVC